MTTIHQALALAHQEEALGNIEGFWVDRATRNGPVIWATSPDGGDYVWWTPADENPDR